MHTGTLKKLALALTFWLALHTSVLKAQIFTDDLPLQAVTTGTNPVDFEFRADGTLIAKGNFGVGSLQTGDTGVGTRMLWFPSLGAFRAGGVSSDNSTAWDLNYMGQYSVAFGLTTRAVGSGSAAFGQSTNAIGDNTLSGGYGGGAAAPCAISWGGGANAAGYCSAAFGGLTVASGGFSFAAGWLNRATGKGSTASGYGNTASGYYSTVSGYSTTASGYSSFATGSYTTASAYAAFVSGRGNVGGGSPTAWVPTDPLFEIGNGTTVPSDALVVYKNGNAVLQGSLQVAPGGDIPMFTGN